VTILSAQPDLEVVGAAVDGVEAVELAGRLTPDLIVMDIRMPRLNGIEATRRLAGHFGERIRQGEAQSKRRAETLAQLTDRELEVLRMLATGRSNAEIAETMFLGTETVKTYVSRVLTKLHLRDRVQAVVLAYRIGLALPDD
jgi:DNA-binding NarL/FixJ family response regulator